ncbi:33719_t:CDS:1, partial [Racocetra persica]
MDNPDCSDTDNVKDQLKTSPQDSVQVDEEFNDKVKCNTPICKK